MDKKKYFYLIREIKNKLSKDNFKKLQSKNLVEKLNVPDKDITIGNTKKLQEPIIWFWNYNLITLK